MRKQHKKVSLPSPLFPATVFLSFFRDLRSSQRDATHLDLRDKRWISAREEKGSRSARCKERSWKKPWPWKAEEEWGWDKLFLVCPFFLHARSHGFISWRFGSLHAASREGKGSVWERLFRSGSKHCLFSAPSRANLPSLMSPLPEIAFEKKRNWALNCTSTHAISRDYLNTFLSRYIVYCNLPPPEKT